MKSDAYPGMIPIVLHNHSLEPTYVIYLSEWYKRSLDLQGTLSIPHYQETTISVSDDEGRSLVESLVDVLVIKRKSFFDYKGELYYVYVAEEVEEDLNIVFPSFPIKGEKK